MMENFKQEFKIYCETVENIKGLEILKQNLFDNVLEDYSKKESSEIFQYKEIFIKKDALGTLMSGSGNSVFGIFDDLKKANECKKEFEKITKQVYLV